MESLRESLQSALLQVLGLKKDLAERHLELAKKDDQITQMAIWIAKHGHPGRSAEFLESLKE